MSAPNKLPAPGPMPLSPKERPSVWAGHLWCEIVLREPLPVRMSVECLQRWQRIGRRVMCGVAVGTMALGAAVFTFGSSWIEDLEPNSCKVYSTSELGATITEVATTLDNELFRENLTHAEWVDDLSDGSVEICGVSNINDADALVAEHSAASN